MLILMSRLVSTNFGLQKSMHVKEIIYASLWLSDISHLAFLINWPSAVKSIYINKSAFVCLCVYVFDNNIKPNRNSIYIKSVSSSYKNS